jgi:ABC-type sugar transport systems, permease components
MFLITTLSLINGFKVFREAYLIAGDYPQEHIYLLQHLFNNWFRDLAVNKLAAGAVLMGIVLFGLIMVFQKLFDRESS